MKQILVSSIYSGPEHLDIPVKVLCSLKDALANSKCSVEIARKYQGELKSHSDAGHDLTLDDPKWVAEQAVNFQQTFGHKVD